LFKSVPKLIVAFIAVGIGYKALTALFFNKPTTSPNERQAIPVTKASNNPITKDEIYQEITLKILDSSGKPIRDGNNQDYILYIEVGRNQYLGEKKFTARYIKFLPVDDAGWIADGRKTLAYSELRAYYNDPDKLVAAQTLICAKQQKTYNENGSYNYNQEKVPCPQ